MGWSLAGIGEVQRVSAGRGTPAFSSTDLYLLGGQELVACPGTTGSASCLAGGTHSTKVESYLKVRFDSATNTWSVWSKDGTRTTYSPTLQVADGTVRWGQTSVTDPRGNTVQYQWTTDSDWYPGVIDYNGYRVLINYEDRGNSHERGERD